jgi:diguanylate cyclase (GGDEF)-like protein
MRDLDGKIVGFVEVSSTRAANPYAGRRRNSNGDSLDPVTGLAPRRFGELHLQTLMRAVAEQATTLGVLYVDADHFKEVNDTFGHKTGDEVLRMVGQSLANGLRRGDIPARWGGEEFLALMPGTDKAGLRATAERVRMLAENSWIQKGEAQVRVTVSVGATMAVPTETPDDLVDRADAFMYASKRAGRNRGTTDTGELISNRPRHRHPLGDPVKLTKSRRRWGHPRPRRPFWLNRSLPRRWSSHQYRPARALSPLSGVLGREPIASAVGTTSSRCRDPCLALGCHRRTILLRR